MFFWMQVWFKCDPDNLGAFKWLSTRPYRNVHNMFSRRGLMHLWLAFVTASADDGACTLQKPLRKPKIRVNYRCNSKKQATQSPMDNLMMQCTLLVPIWMSGQAVMNQKKWQTISMLV